MWTASCLWAPSRRRRSPGTYTLRPEPEERQQALSGNGAPCRILNLSAASFRLTLNMFLSLFAGPTIRTWRPSRPRSMFLRAATSSLSSTTRRWWTGSWASTSTRCTYSPAGWCHTSRWARWTNQLNNEEWKWLWMSSWCLTDLLPQVENVTEYCKPQWSVLERAVDLCYFVNIIRARTN